jgi:hypothetical protein
MNKKDFEELNDLLKENSYTTSFIKDYMLRFRMADIANNAIEYTAYGSVESYNTTSRICELYNVSADNIIDRYNDDMRHIGEADNVRTYCENDNLMGLKKEIDQTKKRYFDQILYQYNHVDEWGYNSGRIADMMIYDEYLNYITDEDFYYDDENPYVVELFYHITTFMQVRSRLEYNGSNIAGLISSFNSLCDDVIRKYWDDHLYDYYGRMRQIFTFDFYQDNDKDFIEAHIYDKKRVTLYSKVLKYLENLCNYTKPLSAEEKYKDADMDSIINNGQIPDTEEEANMKDLYSKLKKIAIFFVQLRKVESDVDPGYFKQFVGEDSYNDVFTLQQQLGNMDVRDYIVRYNNSQTNILPGGEAAAASARESYLAWERKYIDPFKRLVQTEAKILRDLADRAINFYLNNDDKINNGEIFNKFQECKWSSKSTVFKDNIKHDFYYIEEPKTVTEQLESPEMNGGSSEKSDDDYDYSEDSLRTMHGVTDYEYWVKYCGIATIVNCMLPMYWPTGLVITGVPIPMPIIYIPFVVINGRVTVVIGLGICGICPLPMLLFVNLGDMPGSLIPAINIAVDTLQALAAMIPSLSIKPIKATIRSMIEAQDKKINDYRQQKDDLKITINNLKSAVKTDKETLRNLRKRRKEDPTTNTKQNLSNT